MSEEHFVHSAIIQLQNTKYKNKFSSLLAEYIIWLSDGKISKHKASFHTNGKCLNVTLNSIPPQD